MGGRTISKSYSRQAVNSLYETIKSNSGEGFFFFDRALSDELDTLIM